MLSLHDYELIEKHVLGTLDPEESLLFEKRMKDALFVEELRLYRDIQRASIDLGRSEIRKEFTTWDIEEQEQKKTSRINWNWTKIAAAVLFLIAFGVITTYLIPSTSTTQLYLEYYKPYPNLIDPVQKGAPKEDVSLSQLYEMSDYAQVEKMTPKDSLEAFYFALSHLALNQFETAITILQPIAEDSKHRFYPAAQWYLALAYLQTESDKGEAILSVISQSANHDFSGSARDLLDQLN
ncbi:MAG: hypothetical protein IPL46_19560 [Saprospiraceae bacterium]|nr:hypothetical protein [Saprospiraceae bacterium]